MELHSCKETHKMNKIRKKRFTVSWGICAMEKKQEGLGRTGVGRRRPFKVGWSGKASPIRQYLSRGLKNVRGKAMQILRKKHSKETAQQVQRPGGGRKPHRGQFGRSCRPYRLLSRL